MTASRGPLQPSPEAALRGTPPGGGFSTAGNMQRFCAALLAGRLTNQVMLKALTSPQRTVMPARGDDRTAVVVLSNRGPPAATALFRQVRAALFDPARSSRATPEVRP